MKTKIISTVIISILLCSKNLFSQDTLTSIVYQQIYEGGIYYNDAITIGKDSSSEFISFRKNPNFNEGFLSKIDSVFYVELGADFVVQEEIKRIDISNKKLIRRMNKSTKEKITRQFLSKVKIKYVIVRAKKGTLNIPNYNYKNCSQNTIKQIDVVRVKIRIIG